MFLVIWSKITQTTQLLILLLIVWYKDLLRLSHFIVLIQCRSASLFKYHRLCRRWDCALYNFLHSHWGLDIHWEFGAPPSFPSLQSGGNRVQGSPKWSAIFTTLCSIRGLLPGDLLQAALPKPRNLTLGQLSPEVMENIWPAAWLQGLLVQPQCY